MIIYYGASNFTQNKELGRFGKPLSVLEPFELIRKNGIKKKEWWDRYFLDSGAFSISQGGKPIDIQEYIDWLKIHEKEVDIYACFDVVGDGEASLFNWRRMKNEGLNPIPVFHDGEPFEILEEYAKHTNYIGLGAVAYKSTKARLLFFDRVFTMFPDNEKYKFHGFGVFGHDLLLRYPWESVDATSLSIWARLGGIYYPGIGCMGINPQVHPDRLRWRKPLADEIMRGYIEGLGLNYEIAQGQDRAGILERILVSLHYFESLREKVPKIFDPDFCSTPLF